MTFALFLLSAAWSVQPTAQDHSNHAAHGAPAAPAAPAPAPAPATAATATAAKFSLDTPIATLMADARAKAAVDAVLPDVAAHPAYDQVKELSFNQIAPMAPTLLTPDVLAKLKANLGAIK